MNSLCKTKLHNGGNVLGAWIDRLYLRYLSILQKEFPQTGLNVTYTNENFEKTPFEPIASPTLVSIEQKHIVFSIHLSIDFVLLNSLSSGKIRRPRNME